MHAFFIMAFISVSLFANGPISRQCTVLSKLGALTHQELSGFCGPTCVVIISNAVERVFDIRTSLSDKAKLEILTRMMDKDIISRGVGPQQFEEKLPKFFEAIGLPMPMVKKQYGKNMISALKGEYGKFSINMLSVRSGAENYVASQTGDVYGPAHWLLVTHFDFEGKTIEYSDPISPNIIKKIPITFSDTGNTIYINDPKLKQSFALSWGIRPEGLSLISNRVLSIIFPPPERDPYLFTESLELKEAREALKAEYKTNSKPSIQNFLNSITSRTYSNRLTFFVDWGIEKKNIAIKDLVKILKELQQIAKDNRWQKELRDLIELKLKNIKEVSK